MLEAWHRMLRTMLAYGWLRLLRLFVILALILLGLFILRYGLATVPVVVAVLLPPLFVAAFVR